MVPLGDLHQERALRGLLLRPPVWRRRDHRLLGLQPNWLRRSCQFRHDAGHIQIQSPADRV
jgi:hypothetical protein